MELMRKAISLITAGLFVLFTLRIIWLTIEQKELILVVIIISILLSSLAYGLCTQARWALQGTAFIYLLIALSLPLIILNPFAAGDYLATGKEPPTVQGALFRLAPVMAILLAIVYVLHPKKVKSNNKN